MTIHFLLYDMNYLKHYNLLISSRLNYQEERTKFRKLKYLNFDKHHIVPKCIGGLNTKNNLILLTCREHYVAHWLLSKIYPKTKLINALWRLSTCNNKYIGKNSRKYELNRLIFIKYITGKKLTSEHKHKISIALSGNKSYLYQTKPWNTRNSIKYKLSYNWYKLDKIYNIWRLNNHPGRRKLLKYSIENDNLLIPSDRSFHNMIEWFKNNGNPIYNQDWIKFKNQYIL